MLAPKTPTRYGRIRAYALIIRARTCKKYTHTRVKYRDYIATISKNFQF